MCGFAGILSSRPDHPDDLSASVQGMIGPIAHRGPDDQGVWIDAGNGVALGFRRLAIIDLSEHGHQPMLSASGRYTLVFNGEVFNHRDLRGPLEARGHPFRGHSDTEVILAAFEEYGIAAAVPRFIGMFAIAVWDRDTRSLTFIRDRLGIKPLYIRSSNGVITFGSELKAIAAHTAFQPRLDRVALLEYLRYLYVPAPRTIYEDTIKLLPGHTLTVAAGATELPVPVAFWSAAESAAAGREQPLVAGDAEAVAALDGLLRDAVQLRLEADVPLGALLSGGIDSSTVVAIMQDLAPRPVRTYTIGFDVAAYDETQHAAAVAAHMGTEHTAVRVSGAEALDVVPLLAEMFDEPHADPSQIPTFLVCALARRDVTVALTGDGGDEIFGGYNRYVSGARLLRNVARLPRPLQQAAGAAIGAFGSGQWDRAVATAAYLVPLWRPPRLAGEKLLKVAALLREDSTAGQYRSLLSVWPSPGDLLRNGASVVSPGASLRELEGRPLEDWMMLADQRTYLPDDLLAKVDRASMAVSLEARVPLLDHRVVEFGWRLPLRYKIRNGEGKWILRQVLDRYVPRPLIDREKMGFSIPVAAWMRGPLRPWAESLLEERELDGGGVFDVRVVRRMWHRFLDGDDTLGLGMWAVVMFQAWQARWLPTREHV